MSKNLKKIGDYAFAYCSSLSEINLDNVITIGGGAYGGSFSAALTSEFELNAPKLETLTGHAFQRAKLKKIINLGKVAVLGSDGDINFGGLGTFYECSNLEFVRLPETITTIPSYCFYKSTKLATFICEATAPPTLGSNALGNTPSAMLIYVPDASVDAYKAATNWSTYASRIKPLSEYTE
jgi:hypothetical protein